MNEVNLEHASLDDAVQALKGAARGIVKIGVSKPLPVPDGSSVEGNDTTTDNTVSSPMAEERSGSTPDERGDHEEDRTEVEGGNLEFDSRGAAAAQQQHGHEEAKIPELPNDDEIPPPPLPTR